MKKLYFIILLVLFAFTSSFSQSFYNARRDRSLIFSGGIGLSTYLGELKDGNTFDTKPTLSAGLKYYLTERLSARVEATWFQLTGSDATSGSAGKIARNLSFSSDNFEINGTFAFDIFSSGERYYRRPSVNFYGFTGLGLLYFSPKTTLNGVTYSLPQYRTEGVSYSTITPIIPIGLGVKFKMTRDINLALESGFRMTFTDYLDDASSTYPSNFASLDPLTQSLSYRGSLTDPNAIAGKKRGNPNANDAYFLLQVKLEYYLPTDFLFGKNAGHRKTQHYKHKKSNYRRPKTR